MLIFSQKLAENQLQEISIHDEDDDERPLQQCLCRNYSIACKMTLFRPRVVQEGIDKRQKECRGVGDTRDVAGELSSYSQPTLYTYIKSMCTHYGQLPNWLSPSTRSFTPIVDDDIVKEYSCKAFMWPK